MPRGQEVWWHRVGGRMGGWRQAGSPDVWVFARREEEGGEGLQAQGSLQGFNAVNWWG